MDKPKENDLVLSWVGDLVVRKADVLAGEMAAYLADCLAAYWVASMASKSADATVGRSVVLTETYSVDETVERWVTLWADYSVGRSGHQKAEWSAGL